MSRLQYTYRDSNVKPNSIPTKSQDVGLSLKLWTSIKHSDLYLCHLRMLQLHVYSLCHVKHAFTFSVVAIGRLLSAVYYVTNTCLVVNDAVSNSRKEGAGQLCHIANCIGAASSF